MYVIFTAILILYEKIPVIAILSRLRIKFVRIYNGNMLNFQLIRLFKCSLWRNRIDFIEFKLTLNTHELEMIINLLFV